MTQVQITTMIDIDIKAEAKRKGILIKHILARGWEAMQKDDSINKELREAERKIESMARLIAAQQRSINDTRDQVDEMKK